MNKKSVLKLFLSTSLSVLALGACGSGTGTPTSTPTTPTPTPTPSETKSTVQSVMVLDARADKSSVANFSSDNVFFDENLYNKENQILTDANKGKTDAEINKILSDNTAAVLKKSYISNVDFTKSNTISLEGINFNFNLNDYKGMLYFMGKNTSNAYEISGKNIQAKAIKLLETTGTQVNLSSDLSTSCLDVRVGHTFTVLKTGNLSFNYDEANKKKTPAFLQEFQNNILPYKLKGTKIHFVLNRYEDSDFMTIKNEGIFKSELTESTISGKNWNPGIVLGRGKYDVKNLTLDNTALVIDPWGIFANVTKSVSKDGQLTIQPDTSSRVMEFTDNLTLINKSTLSMVWHKDTPGVAWAKVNNKLKIDDDTEIELYVSTTANSTIPSGTINLIEAGSIEIGKKLDNVIQDLNDYQVTFKADGKFLTASFVQKTNASSKFLQKSDAGVNAMMSKDKAALEKVMPENTLSEMTGFMATQMAQSFQMLGNNILAKSGHVTSLNSHFKVAFDAKNQESFASKNMGGHQTKLSSMLEYASNNNILRVGFSTQNFNMYGDRSYRPLAAPINVNGQVTSNSSYMSYGHQISLGQLSFIPSVGLGLSHYMFGNYQETNGLADHFNMGHQIMAMPHANLQMAYQSGISFEGISFKAFSNVMIASLSSLNNGSYQMTKDNLSYNGHYLSDGMTIASAQFGMEMSMNETVKLNCSINPVFMNSKMDYSVLNISMSTSW